MVQRPNLAWMWYNKGIVNDVKCPWAMACLSSADLLQFLLPLAELRLQVWGPALGQLLLFVELQSPLLQHSLQLRLLLQDQASTELLTSSCQQQQPCHRLRQRLTQTQPCTLVRSAHLSSVRLVRRPWLQGVSSAGPTFCGWAEALCVGPGGWESPQWSHSASWDDSGPHCRRLSSMDGSQPSDYLGTHGRWS